MLFPMSLIFRGLVLLLLVCNSALCSAIDKYVDDNGGYDFTTLTAAKTTATAPGSNITKIIVRPGTYYEGDLLIDGVDWEFQNGAVVIAPQDIPIFSDHEQAVTCTVTGMGQFFADMVVTALPSGVLHYHATIEIGHVDSDVSITAYKIVNISTSTPAICQWAGTLYVYGLYIEAGEWSGDTYVGGGYDAIVLTDTVDFEGHFFRLVAKDNCLELFGMQSSSLVSLSGHRISSVTGAAIQVFSNKTSAPIEITCNYLETSSTSFATVFSPFPINVVLDAGEIRSAGANPALKIASLNGSDVTLIGSSLVVESSASYSIEHWGGSTAGDVVINGAVTANKNAGPFVNIDTSATGSSWTVVP